jgi:ankyrin repeat protein
MLNFIRVASAEDLVALLHKGDITAIKEYVTINRVDLTSLRLAKHSVLDFAISTGVGPEVLKYPIEAGCAVNEEFGKTRLSLLLLAAITSTNPDVIKLLIDRGADVQHVDSYNRTALMLAVSRRTSIAGIQADDLLVDIDTINRSDAVVFSTMEILLNAGVPVDARDVFGFTALTIAATGSTPSVINFLAGRGASISVRDVTGLTPFTWAVEYNTGEAVKLFLHFGASVRETDYTGQTILFRAFDRQTAGDSKIIDALIEAGADIDLRDHLGQTPMMYAVQRAKDVKLIDALLRHEPDLTARDRSGEDVLALAMSNEALWQTPTYWLLNDMYWTQAGKKQ